MRKQRHAVPPQLERLEQTIRRLLEEHATVRERAERAEARVLELEQAVTEISEGRLDPAALGDELRALQERNRALRERMDAARAVVERITTRLQFAEEER